MTRSTDLKLLASEPAGLSSRRRAPPAEAAVSTPGLRDSDVSEPLASPSSSALRTATEQRQNTAIYLRVPHLLDVEVGCVLGFGVAMTILNTP